MLNPTTQGIAYITGNINKRPIIAKIAANEARISGGMCKIVFLNSPDGKVLALGTINNW